MKIGILGGTFDPIHEGHLLLARAAREQFNLDKILFIPAFIPTHKAGKIPVTAAAHRYRMTELAVKEEPGLEVSDIEFSRPEASYTVETLRSLHALYPRDEFYLILGADSAREIPKWKDPEEILHLARILAAGRPGTNQEECGVVPYEFIPMAPCALSSSAIRKDYIAGRQPEGVPPAVMNYITKMRLYTPGADV